MASVERMNADRRRAEQGARTMRFITATKVVSPRGNHCRAFSTAPAQSHRSLRLSGKAQFSAKDGRRPRNRPRCSLPDHLKFVPPYNNLNYEIPSEQETAAAPP